MTRACVFSLDDKFVMPWQVLFWSLVNTESLPPGTPIYILHSNTLSDGSIKEVSSFARRFGSSPVFVNVTDQIPRNLPLRENDGMSEATFYRLFVASILPEDISSAVYVDADMIALRSCRELFEMPLSGLVAAVDHCYPRLSFQLWGPKGGSYFQAGLLVIDLDRWRELGIEDQFRQTMETEYERIRFHDQDVLNLTLADHWQRLDVFYNVCTWLMEILPEDYLLNNAALAHFTAGAKPWLTLNRYLFSDAWDAAYLEVFGTPFDRKPLTPKVSFPSKVKRAITTRVKGLIKGAS